MGLLSTIGAASARAYGFTRSAIAAAVDAYFNRTTLLLNTNSTNGAQNNTFIDSSSNNFTITRNGNTTQGTFTPFSQTGWSNYFNGSTDFLSVASNAAFGFGTGDFTYEFFLYLTASPGSGAKYTLVDFRPSNTGTPHTAFVANSAGTLYLGFYNGTSDVTSSSQPLTTNTWYHCAYSRASGTLRIYVNGQQAYSAANTIDYQASRPIIIGASIVPSEYTPGYISNFRVTKGGALYTSTFTPPTSPLTTTVSVGTVSLLTCQSNRFVDNSSNAFTITTSGTPSVQAFSPFAPTAAYSTTTVGGSGYFDGTGDYLTVANNAAFNFGTGDFTVEFWFYALSGATANDRFISNDAYTSAGIDISWESSSSRLSWYILSTAYTIPIPPINTWNHVVWCRSGTTLRTYINGSLANTYTGISTNITSANALAIGAYYNSSNDIAAYISNVRLLKGTALYTGSTYTVPTSPFTNITNTSLLLNFTNAGIYDATAKNDLETVGNAQVSTTQAKFGTTSMYFDGAGDYLITPYVPLFDMWRGDMTAEAWVYFNSVANSPHLFMFSEPLQGSNRYAVVVYFSGSVVRLFTQVGATGSDKITGTTSLSTGQWYHIALTKSGTTFTLWVNGVSQGTSTTTVYPYGVNERLTIGFQSDSGISGDYLNAYVDEARITRGYARYTSNFTPPSAAFPVQ